MTDIANGRIETPEVSLYYTIRGTGPILLILQGGGGNADGSESLANELADRFTVVTCDRRGLSRSKPVRTESNEIATHAADAAHLIAGLSAEPVFVFGSSMGALIGLELAAHHGARVRKLIAHEAPVYGLLEGPEQEEVLRSQMELQETFHRGGLPAAMKMMLARSGVDLSDREADVPLPTPSTDPQAAEQRFADLQYFFSRDVPAAAFYEPDLAALRAAKSKIVPAVGAGSPATLAKRCAVALAEMLGIAVVEFRGGHTGYVLRPKATAAKIAELFRS